MLNAEKGRAFAALTGQTGVSLPRHSRHVLSGIHLGLWQRDPCHTHAGMTKGGWIPASNRGDDRREWSVPAVVIENPSGAFSDGYLPQARRYDKREMEPR